MPETKLQWRPCMYLKFLRRLTKYLNIFQKIHLFVSTFFVVLENPTVSAQENNICTIENMTEKRKQGKLARKRAANIFLS